ncbi:PREDICTED: (-)-germacrene D synthase-like [Nelumbo nucifera]|uniref:(-)-germacrene D synthase-like n=2 Tax=Nelumbo nucifera TaxID=4432 RepID=A0A1U7YTG3_NELNU|nr:PREDICTED: (-)-germacrene D synthase-like [Nelumbo nucifera]DAD20686.1 TPA_asm: hypothetical protein HUJ06_022149 [Nelumbo nucifera]
MSSQISSCPPTQHSSSEAEKTELIRHTTNFHPSIWGDRFITYTCDNMKLESYNQQVEELKEEVRSILRNSANKPLEMLSLIDAVQRLGLGYHFEREINKMLEQIFDAHIVYFNDMDDNLNAVALLFRLLRQHGYNIPCDVFKKFKDEDGKLRESLARDIQGMLSLYEAAYLGKRGEEVLDEALAFTTAHLKSTVATDTTSPTLVKQVKHALEQPLHRGIPKIEARHYISFYEEDKSRNQVLLKLAKLDFNRTQLLYLNELSQVSRWWKNIDFTSKTPYARDRLAECYFWSAGALPEPQYSLGRKTLAKIVAINTILDDTYDAYGTFEELQLLTDAIRRWDANETDKLPEYMKVIYVTLLDIYNEIEEEMRKEGRCFCVSYAKEAMKDLIEAYQIEATWLKEGHIPTFEEFSKLGLITSTYIMMTNVIFACMGEMATKEVFDWLSKTPDAVKSSCIIGRFSDDIMTNEFEQERGHVCSAIECYMKQYGVSREEANNELRKIVTKAWKVLNEECITPTAAPMPLLIPVVNLARLIEVVYKHGDAFTNVTTGLKTHIKLLLIDPITI